MPAPTPVIRPLDAFTVATAALLEDQTPPASPLVKKEVVPFPQIFCVPPRVPALGAVVTVTERVAVEAAHPPAAAIVYVMVAVPELTPVTTPVELFTVAIPGLLEVHAPPLLPSVVNVVVPAAQIACVPDNVPAVLQGRNTRNIAPLRSDADRVTVPLPVAPAVGLFAHAAATAPSSKLVVTLSYNSVSDAGLVAAQPEWLLSLLTNDNIITAEFAVLVVTEVAVAVLALVKFSVPGSISNGPPAVPSAFKPPVAVAPEKATMLPMAMSASELGKAKLNEEPSVPSATR